MHSEITIVFQTIGAVAVMLGLVIAILRLALPNRKNNHSAIADVVTRAVDESAFKQRQKKRAYTESAELHYSALKEIKKRLEILEETLAVMSENQDATLKLLSQAIISLLGVKGGQGNKPKKE